MTDFEEAMLAETKRLVGKMDQLLEEIALLREMVKRPALTVVQGGRQGLAQVLDSGPYPKGF